MQINILLTAITALPLLATAQVTSAISGLSSQCQSGALSLVTSGGFGNCADVVGLVSVLSATGSIITPLNSWLNGACSQTCSSTVLANASSTIESACASDISSGSAIAIGLETLISNYTEVRDVLCLQATSNSTFCLSNLLTAVQNSTGTQLNVSTLTNLLTDGISGLTSLAQSIPSSALCTDCTHAEISKLQKLASATSTSSTSEYSSALSAVSSECGANFVDGSVPSTVKEVTSNSSSSGNPAVSSTSLSGAEALVLEKKMVAIVVGMIGAVGFGAWSTLI